jgi:hypothetical protein
MDIHFQFAVSFPCFNYHYVYHDSIFQNLICFINVPTMIPGIGELDPQKLKLVKKGSTQLYA